MITFKRLKYLSDLDARRISQEWVQTENEVPQPQEEVAFGLSKRKERPMRSSTKSRRDPRRKGSETSSIATRAPSRSITRSSVAGARTTSKPYWNPEQPPPL